MARKIGEAFIRVRPDTEGFLKEGDGDVNRAGHRLGNTFGGAFTKAFGQISVALGSVFAVGKAVSEVQQSIGLARDLAETQSAVNVIFGQGAAKVKAFADNAVDALGQTRNQALGAANTFATFGKSAGLSGDNLVGFATKLVGLSTDLASFKNTSPEQAIQAIGAALRGESEPIRSYGILLDDATLRQRALALGIVNTTKNSLTPQQRVLAAQAEIFAQSTDAQGDYIRTLGGLANQQRKTSAAIAETKTKLGDLLLPAVTAVTVFFNSKFLPVLSDRLIPALTRVRDWFANVIVPAIQDRVIPAVAQLHSWFAEKVVPNFRDHVLPVLQDLGHVLVDNVIPALAEITRVVVAAFAWLTDTSQPAEALRFILIGLASAIAAIAVVEKITAIATAIWTGAQWLLNAAMTANPAGIVILGIAALVAAIVWVATKTTWFQATWEAVWGFLKMVGGWFAGPFAGFFVTAWNSITNRFSNAKDTIIGGWNSLVGFVTGLPGRIAGAASGMWNGFVAAFRNAINSIIGVWNRLEFRVPSASFLGITIGGFTIGTPDIPYLARGGLVDRTGLAVVHRGELYGPIDALASALAQRDRGAVRLHAEDLRMLARLISERPAQVYVNDRTGMQAGLYVRAG
jgi:hypothetical protein